MRNRFVRSVAVLLVVMLCVSMTGCWDNKELDTLFIVTCISLDLASDMQQLDIGLQIGKARSNSSASGGKGSSEDATILLKTTNDTVMQGIMDVNRDSSRVLLLQHNQALLIGSELAEQGIEDRIDMFIRDEEARMEVLVLIVDGKAEDILSAKFEQNEISGMYISRFMRDQYNRSINYRSRMLDLVSKFRDGKTSPAIPIIQLSEEDGKSEMKITGMGMFKDGKMVGKLDDEQSKGYVWAMGDVKDIGVIVEDKNGTAILHIDGLETKREVRVEDNGGVHIGLSVDANMTIGELRGFDGMDAEEMIKHLEQLAQMQIKKQIMETYQVTRESSCDIFSFGMSVYRSHPKEWKEMKDKWDDIYKEIDLNVEVKAHVPITGQIVKSLEMEDKQP
ncbi:MAG: Ger(x)C family spore germination protein [Clostridiaceae bacterium]|nr:Ger(x)C family spore germination protein [Clostridiaceae bacterium]